MNCMNYRVKLLTGCKEMSIVYQASSFEAAEGFLDKTYDYYGRHAHGIIEHIGDNGKVIEKWDFTKGKNKNK